MFTLHIWVPKTRRGSRLLSIDEMVTLLGSVFLCETSTPGTIFKPLTYWRTKEKSLPTSQPLLQILPGRAGLVQRRFCRRLSELLLELVTVGIPSYFRCRRDLDPRHGVHAPALAPPAVGGHVALERRTTKTHKLDQLENTREERGRGGK